MEVLHKWNDQEIHQRSFLHRLERGRGGGSTLESASNYTHFIAIRNMNIKISSSFLGERAGGRCWWGNKNYCRTRIEHTRTDKLLTFNF